MSQVTYPRGLNCRRAVAKIMQLIMIESGVVIDVKYEEAEVLLTLAERR